MGKGVVDLKNNNYNQVMANIAKYISTIKAVNGDINSAMGCLSFSVDLHLPHQLLITSQANMKD